ncbi:hypothetical protein DFH94DRAFT_134165 [Russula ochroleuca]|jgi:hypothetical protein|uniref:Uncharacterized protein n=1 Tax=Russula ochroleuca TaxID=152965 RepID=A0A9P5JT92_9AGAM|nr:hypothetical protein DFH94DRAFT_84861 [Russula ochroleuca]KAF8474518.1 hypothetical protein DFH94DRAFT_134165 [Russula ochroleuca]
MAVMLPPLPSTIPPHKRRRRTATSVLAGDFDPRPTRDVLTSLLNGVPRYTAVESTDDFKRERRREKKARESVKKRAKSAQDAPVNGESGAHHDTIPSIADTTLHPKDFLFNTSSSSAWGSRPVLCLATTQRSVSVTPPPMPSSPPTTPGRSISSSTSQTSSKRPHTPGDDSDLDESDTIAEVAPLRRHRKKRPAARKGWKGWVEGSPPPSEKLIKLDDVQVLEERRTRSGKSFDAIGLGKDSWV